VAYPFADISDVSARWRPLTSDEETQADALLRDASARLRAEFPTIDAQLTSGSVDPDAVVAVACRMVIRAMVGTAAGQGVTQQSQTAGPFSSSATFANPMGNLYITRDDERLIRGYWPAATTTSDDPC